jgi:nicotinate-nucleotide--dimethylbenzimidazole phosphoribosyltransferase
VLVVDMGIKNPSVLNTSRPHPDFIGDLAVARGTANFLRSPAMTTRQAQQAQAVGRKIVTDHLVRPGVRLVALGDMGIGNTTSASALAAALTGLPASEVTGRGSGVDIHRWRRKVRVVEKALDLHFPNRHHRPVDPDEALWALGGFEIAGLAGVAREAAAQRMLVILDGFISSVAGLIAARQDPEASAYFVAAHRSVEAGHRAVLEALKLNPLLDLELRLGEGSGAALALNLIHSAADIMRDMATFNAAGVSSRFA